MVITLKFGGYAVCSVKQNTPELSPTPRHMVRRALAKRLQMHGLMLFICAETMPDRVPARDP